jgi:acetolactate synthase-1/2/3 large subunit
MGLEEFGLDYGNPDFVSYAESYGAHGHRVASSECLLTTMQKCHQQNGVHVIEVPVD